MKFTFLLILISILFYSCEEEKKYDTKGKLNLLKRRIKKSSYRYDRPQILSCINNIILEKDDIFSDSLNIEQSPINDTLYCKLGLQHISNYKLSDSVEIYRLNIWRAFNPEKIILTIFNNKNDRRLLVQSIRINPNCINEYTNPNPEILSDTCFIIIKNKTIRITQHEWSEFLKNVSLNEYWSSNQEDNRYGHDGSGWHLEGSKPVHTFNVNYQKYHSVHRWSPAKGNRFREIGEYLLELSGEDWDRIY